MSMKPASQQATFSQHPARHASINIFAFAASILASAAFRVAFKELT